MQVANNLRAPRAGVGKEIKTKAQVAMVAINKAKTRSRRGRWPSDPKGQGDQGSSNADGEHSPGQDSNLLVEIMGRHRPKQDAAKLLQQVL